MKRRILNSKANRPLSIRGQQVGKDGHFVGALIGLAGSVAGHFIGKEKAKKDAATMEAEEKANLLTQGQEMQGQQDIMDAQHSQSVLATYNPQGSAQMYAKNGARAYPYQDQPDVAINPTIMYRRGGLGYQKGGRADDSDQIFRPKFSEDAPAIAANNASSIGFMEGVQAERGYDENQFQPNYMGIDMNTALGKSYGNLNEAESNVIRRQQKQKHPSTGKLVTHGEVADWMTTNEAQQWYGQKDRGSHQDARQQQTSDANERIQRLATMGGDELPPQYNQDYVNQGIVTDEETLGTSYANFKDRLPAGAYDHQGKVVNQMGGRNMYDELQDTNMQEYQSYQEGGAAQVPGGQIEQETERAQVVNGDDPGMIDDVELGTNPGEPQAMVDHGEVLVDSVDENGQPFKQIFSDTVLVPGKNTSMAKEAKKLLKQVPKDEESEQAKHVYAKLDTLFETQQMLNGDSQGEDPGEAAQGGMDPNAAQQMGQEGTQAFQYGGEDYYNEGMREEMMQVPYPKKNLQGGGFLSGAFDDLGGGSGLSQVASGVSKGLSAGMKGYGTGYGMEMSDTDAGKAGYGMMAAQNMLGDASSLAGGIGDSIQQRQEEQRNLAAEQQSEIGQQNFQAGGGYYEEESMNMQDMYDHAKSFADFFEETYQLPNTLSDMQASANPKGWGHNSTENGLRRNSNLMGRMHRAQNVDSTPVVSPSERGGPTPKKRGFVMGGRLYTSTLNRKSLTLSIQ